METVQVGVFSPDLRIIVTLHSVHTNIHTCLHPSVDTGTGPGAVNQHTKLSVKEQVHLHT